MKQVSRQLLETILRISASASKDETRPNICGVHVFKRDSMVIVEACDGYVMARETIMSEEFFDHEVIFCSKDIKKLKKLLKDYKTTSFNCSMNDKAMIIEVASEVVSIALINREFPRIDSIIPSKKDGEVAIAINPEYLLTLFESLKLNKGQSHIMLRFDPCNPMAAIKASVGNESQTAVIMPCRSSEVEQLSQDFQRLISIKKGA